MERIQQAAQCFVLAFSQAAFPHRDVVAYRAQNADIMSLITAELSRHSGEGVVLCGVPFAVRDTRLGRGGFFPSACVCNDYFLGDSRAEIRSLLGSVEASWPQSSRFQSSSRAEFCNRFCTALCLQSLCKPHQLMLSNATHSRTLLDQRVASGCRQRDQLFMVVG